MSASSNSADDLGVSKLTFPDSDPPSAFLDITNNHIQAFGRDGFVLMRAVLDPSEVDLYSKIVTSIVEQEMNKMNDSERMVGASGSRFLYDVRTIPKPLKHLIYSVAIAKMAASLLQVRRLRLLHYNCFFKPPHGIATPWHQDCTYIPLNTSKIVSAWIPLTSIDPEMGSLNFSVGSHRRGLCPLSDPSMPGEMTTEQFLLSHGHTLYNIGSMALGDVSFHNSFVLHGSLPNVTDKFRKALVICYYEDRAKIGVPDSLAAHRDLFESFPYSVHFKNNYFPHLKVGDPAVSMNNPIVYDSQFII
jgi:ectoine hydroxylase-related dioxygenase (phytanoyl-CoA dioxygenase family)